MFGLWRAIRRRRLARRPLPEGWLEILEAEVPFFVQLDEAQRARFLRDLKIFVWEKHFEGAGGMEIDDTVRVVIAACAVRLSLSLGVGVYERLSEIVVYPGAYRHPDSNDVVLGEARHWGTVVLSWQAVRHGLGNQRDGHDTALHEFAHVLDRADGAFDGTPVLERYGAYGPWARVMSAGYTALRGRRREARKVLRAYGATNEAEFFAVASESFFEKPEQLRRRMPELYQQLKAYYRCDPAARQTELG